MEAHLLTWAPAGVTTIRLLAAEAPAGDDHTAQIIVALIGALALVLVSLIPALVNRSQKKDATTTPAPPSPTSASEELARVWTAIEGLRNGQQRSFREHAGYEALLDECRRDNEQTNADVARTAADQRRELDALRDQFHRHIYGAGHGSGA